MSGMDARPCSLAECGIFDMHCHLGFAGNAPELAEAAAQDGVGALCATVGPVDYVQAKPLFGADSNVRVGLGLHPWWVADGRCGEAELALFEQLAPDAPFIAEVGLDFGRRFSGTEDVQTAAFERVLAACSVAADGSCVREAPAFGRLLSLHAVRAAGAVLDLLERYGMPARSACVFHWFSGTPDELQRAVRAGCYFSVGQRMLATRRGRAYARDIPADRLLLETDFPSGPVPAAPVAGQAQLLRGTLAQLQELRNRELGAQIARTSRQLLGVQGL